MRHAPATTTKYQTPTLPDVYARAEPEIAVEIRSSSDREKNVRETLAWLRAKGSIVAIYTEPRSHQFAILRAGQEPEIFRTPTR